MRPGPALAADTRGAEHCHAKEQNSLTFVSAKRVSDDGVHLVVLPQAGSPPRDMRTFDLALSWLWLGFDLALIWTLASMQL